MRHCLSAHLASFSVKHLRSCWRQALMSLNSWMLRLCAWAEQWAGIPNQRMSERDINQKPRALSIQCTLFGLQKGVDCFWKIAFNSSWFRGMRRGWINAWDLISINPWQEMVNNAILKMLANVSVHWWSVVNNLPL